MPESKIYSVCMAFEAGYEEVVSVGKCSVNPYPADTQEHVAFDIGQQRGFDFKKEQLKKYQAADKGRKFFRNQLIEETSTHSVYRVVNYGINQSDQHEVSVIEKINDGTISIRDLHEIESGKFKSVKK